MISLIVPVYNTAKTLPKCIESILGQTYRDLELILIDDGSEDDSFSICNKYAETDRRIKVIGQVNSGVSSARNKGLDMAVGDYIGFIDSDDYIDPDMFRTLADYLAVGYDFAACGWKNETESGVIQQFTKGKTKILNCSDEILSCMFQHRGCAPNVCNKLLKRELIQKYKISFPHAFKVGEDMVMLCAYALKCNKGIYITEPMYHYITRENSAYHKRFVPGIFEDGFYNEINAHKAVLNILPEGKAKRCFLIKVYYVYLRTMKFLCYAGFPDKELYREIIRYLRCYLIRYLISRMNIKQKIHALLMSASPRLWLALAKRRGN